MYIFNPNQLKSPQILADDRLSGVVSGIGVHWYHDTQENLANLREVRSLFPDQFLLHTEACTGSDASPSQRVILGDWGRAEQYATSIIQV